MKMERPSLSSCGALLGAAVLATILVLGSCSNPLAPPPGPQASAEEGRVLLSLAAESAKIVLPLQPSIASYQLFGGREGASLESLGSWSSLSGASVSVQTGSWDFLLEAYDEGGKLVLEGSLPDQAIETATSLSFHLLPLESGTGSVKVTLLWPYSGGIVASVETRFDGNLLVPALEPFPAPPMGLGLRFEKTGVPAGNYLLVFKLLDAQGKTVAARSEWVLVRKDLASEKEIGLSPLDLNYLPAAPTDLIINQAGPDWDSLPVSLSWNDASDNETGFLVSYSDDEGASWQTAATLAAKTTLYNDDVPRGLTRRYELRAFNDLGNSNPASSSISATGQISFDTIDDSIRRVVVNLWDPATLALQGTTTLTRYGSYLVGGLQPTATGSQLVQAYAYDAAGKIRAVAETTASISNPGDSIALTAQPARLMGGNVQKTGQSLDTAAPVMLSAGAMGVSLGKAYGLTCDGLNLYLIDQGSWSVKRVVISSRAVATFAGAGAGRDEDNPGYAPDFSYKGSYSLTTDGSYLYLGLQYEGRIERISFVASAKNFFTFPEADTWNGYHWDVPGLVWATTDGNYLYLEDSKIQRLELSSLTVSYLDPADWAWKPHATQPPYSESGFTTDGSRLFWANISTGELYSMSAGGGDAAVLAPFSRDSSVATDGTKLYGFAGAWVLSDDNLTYVYTYNLMSADIATGAATQLGSPVSGYARVKLIATDGVTLFGYGP